MEKQKKPLRSFATVQNVVGYCKYLLASIGYFRFDAVRICRGISRYQNDKPASYRAERAGLSPALYSHISR